MAAWPESSVTVTGAVGVSSQNAETRRPSCKTCGDGVLATKPGLGCKVADPLTLSGSEFACTPDTF